MDDTKLNKIKVELAKARSKRDSWDKKVKILERRYRETENTCIHTMVHAANLSPEQLAELLQSAFPVIPLVDSPTEPSKEDK